ncbi:MAG: DMT family transporter [Flavicella sp.]
MKILLLYILAFTGGVSLAIQAGLNAQLGAFVKQPIVAVIASSIASAVFGISLFILFQKGSIATISFQQTPWYLWFVGGLFSMIGISLYFYTIPKLGLFKMITWGLCGQLLFSVVAGKFGWLHLPVEPITSKKITGAIAMIVGIVLINSK